MLGLRSAHLLRCCRCRLKVASTSFQHQLALRLASTASQRPPPSKSEKERIVERSKDLYEQSPTTAKVVSFWGAASNYRKVLIVIAAGNLMILYIKLCYGAYQTSQARKENREQVRSYGELSVGGPFELEDTSGNMVSSETLKGKWVLLYFGFTYCPDICPEQMEMMASVVDTVKEEHDIEVVPLMITIDLERDTPEVLAEYVAEYSPKIIGLRGTEQQVDDVCNHFRCYRSKGQAYDDPNDYILDHTVTQYIIDPEGRTVGYFMSNRNLAERVPILMGHVEKYRARVDAEIEVGETQSSLLGRVRQFLGMSPATVS